MVATIGDSRTINLRQIVEVFHNLGVLKGLALDLCQGIQINFVTTLFLRGRGRDEQQSSAGGGRPA